MRSLFIAIAAFLLIPFQNEAKSPTLLPNQSWRYTLIDGSAFVNDCEICGRPTFLLPMRGSFDLTFNGSANRYDFYSITNIDFTFTDQNGLTNHVTGGGSAKIGGDFAFQEIIQIQITISNNATNEVVSMTNSSKGVLSAWPSVRFDLREETKSFVRVYKIDLRAAPFRELWYSSGINFTSARAVSDPKAISSGDLLSYSGRLIKRDADIVGRMGIQPSIGTSTPIDAINVLSGGEIAFSLSRDIFSETLGPLHHGDLFGSTGRIIRRNQDLMQQFGVDTNIDYGLDAVQMMENGETLFSITTNTISSNLNLTLSRGDILSDQGTIKKTLRDLLAAFAPVTNSEDVIDVGLDAIYVWPGGEVWFSTEDGFDSALGPISAGDLLSDRGYVVYRNLEIVGKFNPVEDVNNFGLGSIVLISDTTAASTPGHFSSFTYQKNSSQFDLGWVSAGHTFQVEKSSQVEGPYAPASEILLDLFWTDTAAGAPNTKNFYRLLQW